MPQSAWTALPRLLSSLRYFHRMMSGRGTDSKREARNAAASASSTSSDAAGEQPEVEDPGRRRQSARRPPRARGVRSASSRTGRARGRTSERGCARWPRRSARATTGTPARPRPTRSRAAASVSWLFTASTTTSSGVQATSAGSGVTSGSAASPAPRVWRGRARGSRIASPCGAAGDQRHVVPDLVEPSPDRPPDPARSEHHDPHGATLGAECRAPSGGWADMDAGSLGAACRGRRRASRSASGGRCPTVGSAGRTWCVAGPGGVSTRLDRRRRLDRPGPQRAGRDVVRRPARRAGDAAAVLLGVLCAVPR